MDVKPALLLLCFAYMTGCSPASKPMAINSTSPPMVMEKGQSIRLGESVQGRPISMEVFGSNRTAVLVMGGIHGNERASVVVAQRLAEHLRAHPQLTQNVTVAVLPIANPDGYAANTRTNANNVDVNRNFPAENWRLKRSRSNFGGAQAASEPEARAVMNAIETLRPALLISIHSIGEQRQCNNYDGPAEPIARVMSQRNHYPVAETIGYPTPGSLGSYAGIDRQIPMITLELPAALPGEPAWQSNRDALLAAIAAVAR